MTPRPFLVPLAVALLGCSITDAPNDALTPDAPGAPPAGATDDAGAADSGPAALDAGAADPGAADARAPSDAAAPEDAGPRDAASSDAPAAVDAGPPPAYCATDPWSGLEACGWPGPANTGPDLTKCPGGALTPMGSTSMPMPVIELGDGASVTCARVSGELHVTGKNVTITNSIVSYDTGKTGTDANGTAPIVVDDGASATVDHVEIDGMIGTHACIWHQGTSLTANAVNCHGVDDGIFSWADTGFSPTTGDDFTITDSYFHDFTTLTSNGHEDGYQTEGASNGVIRHNTYMLTTEADSCVAIWDSLKSSDNILVEGNLMSGGGAAVYADDYSPSETSPQGGFSVTNVTFKDNVFSTHVSPCVGQYFVWYARPAEPYQGGPTDGWKRTGNAVLETGESVDTSNPHVNGELCQ